MAIRLLVLVGPTACGKTRMAVERAHALGSEVISADSRQVYRGLDVGTGKDLEEYERVSPPVRHHLIDVADPRTPYTVFHYQRDCYRLLASRHEERRYRDGTPLVMAGGSGLYVEAVLRGYRIADVPGNPALRASLAGRSLPELVETLRRDAPELLARTDTTSKRRVLRALEIAAWGRERPITYSAPPPVAIDFRIFGVRIPREELARRIDRRLDARLRAGLIEEVAGLLEGGLGAARMEQLGLEYREVTAYLTGAKSRERMVDDLRHGIRRLAKRQATWFRGMSRRGLPVTWISRGDPGFAYNDR